VDPRVERVRLRDALGRRLREARRAAGLTLREAAARSGGRFRPTSIAGYERGERSISVERLAELAAIYQRSPSSILEEAMRDAGGLSTIELPDLGGPTPTPAPRSSVLLLPEEASEAPEPDEIRSP